MTSLQLESGSSDWSYIDQSEAAVIKAGTLYKKMMAFLLKEYPKYQSWNATIYAKHAQKGVFYYTNHEETFEGSILDYYVIFSKENEKNVSMFFEYQEDSGVPTLSYGDASYTQHIQNSPGLAQNIKIDSELLNLNYQVIPNLKAIHGM